MINTLVLLDTELITSWTSFFAFALFVCPELLRLAWLTFPRKSFTLSHFIYFKYFLKYLEYPDVDENGGIGDTSYWEHENTKPEYSMEFASCLDQDLPREGFPVQIA